MPLFADLDRLRADLDALRPLAPEQEARVLQKFRLEWNYNSNAIEGNSLTLGETRSLLLHGVAASGKSIRDHDDIRNHNKAVAEVELLATEVRPITEQLIREMHEILLGREAYYVEARTATGLPTRQLIQPGSYKKNPNQALTATGERIHFASPEETSVEMTDLVDWYRAEEAAPTMPPVDLAAKFHYRFVRIHPFDDGNGRMSRLLMNLILLRHGYPMTVIKATDRNRYLAALSEADVGESEPFLRFIIENVEASLRLMIRAARGEAIDEPSDLDKKLALLKKQVLTQKDVLEIVWNGKAQAEFYNSLAILWLDDLTFQLNKFNELFISNEVEFTCDILMQEGIIYKSDGTLQSAKKLMDATLYDEKELLREMSFRFIWRDFKIFGNAFTQEAMLIFYFNPHHFTVDFKTYDINNLDAEAMPTQILFSAYKREYDSAQIHEINLKLANKVYDFIAAKLDEADTPPA